MDKNENVLGIDIHLFIAATCAIMFVIDILLAIDRFCKGQYYGVIDIVFAFWFGYMSFIKWRDYKKSKRKTKELDPEL